MRASFTRESTVVPAEGTKNIGDAFPDRLIGTRKLDAISHFPKVAMRNQWLRLGAGTPNCDVLLHFARILQPIKHKQGVQG
jgi:hypothetical protein